MSTIGPNFSEGTVVLFAWLAEKLWGGAKLAFDWGWNQAKWNLAQDAYDAAIIARYGQIRIFGQTTPKSLRDIFTTVYVLDTPTANRRFSADELAEHLWNADRGVPFRQGEARQGERLLERRTKCLLLGKPGAGKTTFLKRLTVREAQRGRWGKCLGKVPIFISLKELAEAGKPLFDFIVDQFAVCHFPETAPFIRKLLESGQALVLFDGLDEVTSAEEFQSGQPGPIFKTLEDFSAEFSGCHIVITSRIAATDYLFSPSFTYLEMSDFSPKQTTNFVRSWFGALDDPGQAALADQMLEELGRPEHVGVRDLARSPLLLTLLCLNYDETRSFPARRVEIYKEALDALLKKWDRTRGIKRQPLYRTLSLGRKQQMFAQIAYEAFARGEILFAQSNLEGQIKSYLQHVPEIPPSIDIDVEAVLKEIVAQHGIFAEQARGLFSFAHLTFQEYYTAEYIAGSSTPAAMALLLTHIADRRWREVFLLLASVLPDATAFLTAFERALPTLNAQSTALCTYLYHIDELAQASQSRYRQSALRAWLIAAQTVLDLDHTLDRSSARARARQSEARVLDRNRIHNCALAHAHTLDSELALDSDLPLDRAFARLGQLRALSRDLDHNVLDSYLQASTLFYECLQLAYTPDKRDFEDRMFLPPPSFTPPSE